MSYRNEKKCPVFVIFAESQLSACTIHNNGSIQQERVKIFELWYCVCETVSTKQREESFVILSRTYMNPSLNYAWFKCWIFQEADTHTNNI